MNRNSAELLAHFLALTCMDSSPDLEVQALNRFGDGPTATGCARWPIEGREKAIACSVDLAATITLKLLTHYEVVLTENHARLPISAARCVAPTMSVKSTVTSTRSGSGPLRTAVKQAWISSQSASSAYPRQVIIASKLHVLGPLDMLSQVATMLDADKAVTSTM